MPSSEIVQNLFIFSLVLISTVIWPMQRTEDAGIKMFLYSMVDFWFFFFFFGGGGCILQFLCRLYIQTDTFIKMFTSGCFIALIIMLPTLQASVSGGCCKPMLGVGHGWMRALGERG